MWVEANSGSGGGGGGGETETTLWTNPSPTSNFAGQEVTLSDDYTNYKRIAFYYNSGSSKAVESKVVYDKSDIENTWGYGYGYYHCGAMAIYNPLNIARRIYLRTRTTVNKFYFYDAQRVDDTGSSNGYCIPTKITGIN